MAERDPATRCKSQDFKRWTLPSGEIFLAVARLGDQYTLHFPEVAAFNLDHHSGLIEHFRYAGASDEVLRHLILDHVLPRFVSHTGRLVLHASAVANLEETMLFLGPSGSGKSTLAAFLGGGEYEVVTDDCVLVEKQRKDVVAIASYPGLRLWPESAEKLFPETHERSGGESDSFKRRLSGSRRSPVPPVRAVFVLDDQGAGAGQRKGHVEPGAKEMSGAAALMMLVTNSFPLDATDRGWLEDQFVQAAEVATRVPFFGLRYSWGHSKLRLVEDVLRSALKRAAKNSVS